jgi:hypothetical protein
MGRVRRTFCLPGTSFVSNTSVAIQCWSEPEIFHGAKVFLMAAARVRVHRKLRICLGAGAKAKSVTNNLPLLTVLCKVILGIYLEAPNFFVVRIGQESFY